MARTAAATITTDHDEIRQWAEDRGAHPACVRGTGDKGDIGMLRLDFPGYSGEESLEPISWDEFFEKFDERQLALLHQETTAGGAKSNFNKLVSRETAEANTRGTGAKKAGAKKAGAKKASGKKTAAKKTAAKKAPAKKSAAKKAPAKKTAAKRGATSSTRKTAAKSASRKTTGSRKQAAKSSRGRGR